MPIGLGGMTAGIVEYALDGLSLRHNAIASNIANANSVGYRPIRVSFEHYLAAFDMKNGFSQSDALSSRTLPPPEVQVGLPNDSVFRQKGAEADIVQLNKNVLQYQALANGLDKYMALIATAINEGRR